MAEAQTTPGTRSPGNVVVANPETDGKNGHEPAVDVAPGAGPATGNGSAPGPEGNRAAQKKRGNPRVKFVLALILVVLLFVGVPWGLRFWRYSQTHVNTDDAYVTGNLVDVSPTISGTLATLTVEEGDTVHKDQLIARLSDSSERAALRQAQAAYDAAQTQIPQATLTYQYQEKQTEAAIQRAQAAIAAQQAKTVGASQQVTLTANTYQNQVAQAQSQVKAAEAQAAQADAQVETARASVSSYQKAVQTAERAKDAAQARIGAAQAEVDRTSKDEQRYKDLLAQQAVAQQQYDTAHAAAQSALSQLSVTQQEAAQAQSQVEQAQENVVQAQAQLAAAQKAAAASHQQVEVARAGLALARANRTQVGIQQENVQSNAQQGSQAQADLANALAGRQEVALRHEQISTAEAQAQQAKAALTNAQIAEGDTYIYAPADGTIVKKIANVGVSLQAGQTVVTMTQGDYVWVTANFKETQLKNVRPGQPAEVEVDSFPGRIFKGRVQSINEATGAATSLLPPDNATGNFTKVVQRIPVKIQLIAAGENEDRKYARAADLKNLRQGMSVSATIDTSK